MNPLDTAWDILERYGLALRECDQASEQIRLTLESVREALDADTVCWHPGKTSEEFAQVGLVQVTSHWVHDFVRLEADADRCVRQFLDPGAKSLHPWPTSAAMIRVSRSNNSWLLALSFHPRRLYQAIDLKVLALARRMLLNHRHQYQVYDKLRDSLFGLVRCLTAAIDAKNPFTGGHSERVARMAVRLGKQMGLPEPILSDVYLAGLLHDIGKIRLREEVLQKTEPLTAEDLLHIRSHVEMGEQLVAQLKPLQHLRGGVRHHHERWDGLGYPDGLKGEAIPLQARLLAVADACDAMFSKRPYRPALSLERVNSELLGGAGTQWDPDLIAILMTCREDIFALCQRGQDDQPIVDGGPVASLSFAG